MGRSKFSRYKEWLAFLDHALIAGHQIWGSIPALSGRMDLYTLQKLLTHKSPAMTQRYAHLRDQALRKAADLAGNIIEQFASGPTESGMQI
jgi:integrase